MDNKIKEVYQFIPQGYFKDEAQFEKFASDPKNAKDLFAFINEGTPGAFKDEAQLSSYLDLKKKEPTQLGSGDGESVSQSKSFAERFGEGLAKNRPIMEKESTVPTPTKLGIEGVKPEPLPKTELPVKAKIEKTVQPVTEESKTKYLWESVKKDVDASTSITTQEHFKRLSDEFANEYLDESQKQEYSFVKNLRDADELVKNLQKVLEKNPNKPAAQLSLSKAIAAKAVQETEYTKYKEAKYKQIDAEIKDLEEKVNTSPLFSSFWDNARRDDYINKIKELKSQKENFFLDENALIEKKYSENKTALDKFEIPGNTPKQKLQNYYLTLNKEREIVLNQIERKYNELSGDTLDNLKVNLTNVFGTNAGVDNFIKTVDAVLGTDNGLTDKLSALNEKMKSLAPAVLINRNPIKDVNEGFVESTLKSAIQTLVPATQNLISTPSKLAENIKESLALSSLSDDLLSKTTGQIVTEKAKGPEGLTREWFGNIAGTALGMNPYFSAGTSLVKSASIAMDFAKISKYLAGAKYGKYLVSKPVMTGLGYKVAGYLMPSNSLVKDEATFLSGFFGGIAQAGIEKVINTSYIAQTFNKLFKDQAESMAIKVAKIGERVGMGLGEYGEEVGNTVGEMIGTWASTGDFKKLKADFEQNFGAMDKNLELFVASFTMGAIMSSGNAFGKSANAKSRDYYNNLSANDKKKADSFVQRVTQERYNAMVAAKKADIQETGIKPTPVTPKDLADKQEAIDILTNPQSGVDEKKAALSVLADVDLKIENDKITKAAEAELKAGNTSTEVKPEDAVMEPIPSAEGTIVTKEGTVEPAVAEVKPLTEGDQVQLEPQIKGGMPRIMEFKDNTWQQKVGNEYTTVSKEVQQEAQNLYDSQNKQRVSGEVGVGQEPLQTKPIEGGRQEAPSTSGNVQASEEVTTPTLVTPKIVDNFINTGFVGDDVLTSIAEKIKNNETLTKDENTIFNGKTSEINEILIDLKDQAGTIEQKSLEMANKNVSKFLEKLGVSVNFVNSQEEFEQAAKNEGVKAEKGAQGFFIGESGKIYINKSNLQKSWAKTVLYHEATHPIINIIRNTNPEKYKALVNGLQELSKTNTQVKEALDWVKKEYDGSPSGTIEDEGIVEVISGIASGKIPFGQINPTLRERLIDFMNQILRALGKKEITPKTDTETFKKTAREIAYAMREGKSAAKIVGKENVKEYKYKAVSNLSGQFSITKFGKSGIKKSPVLDKDEYKKKLENGTLKISTPQEALGDSTFMLTFPDDLFVGDIFIGNNKVAEFGGGVVYAIVEGEKGRMWASVSEKTAKAFADNVNKSLKMNNGTSYVVLVKGADTKHVSSMSAKVGFMKTLLRYAEKNESMANGLLTAIKEIYSIGNVAKPELAIKRFDNYLEGGRGEDGQTMKEAKSAYDGLRSALIKYANPLITKMALEMGYGNEYFNGTKLKGKNPVYEASNLTVDKMFADLLQEDFLKGVPAGEAYAVIKTNSEVTIKNDLSHPSYPWVILTKDGSPVALELFDKTFMTFGKNEAITGRYSEPTEGPTGGFGQVSYTVPKFKLNPNKELKGPGTTDLLGAINKYKAVTESKQTAKAQLSKGKRETAVVDGVAQRVASVPDSLSIVDGFYSPIEKRITEFKQPKASATKWKEIVGSKSDEAVFSGIADWLNTFKPDQQISKEEVQNFIKNNRVEIKQVIKADNWREFYDERMAEVEKETEYFRQKGFSGYQITRTPDEMFDKLSDADQDRLINLKAEKDFLNDVYYDYGNSRQVLAGTKEEDMPKYIKYINRGDAQNYKEILVTAPVGNKLEQANAIIEKRLEAIDDEIEQTREYKKVGDTGTVNDFKLVVNDQERYDSLVAERKSLIAQEKANTEKIRDLKNKEYKSSHYNEKNIIVHTRTDVRRDSDDNKVFFIEEVQSDWGQEGKREGFIAENKREAQRQYEIDKNRYSNIQQDIKQEKFNLDKNIEQDADIKTIKKSGIVAWLGLKEFNGKTVFTKDSEGVTPPKKEDIIPSEDLPKNYVDAYNRVKERSKKLDEYMAEKDRLIAKYGLTYNPYGVTSLTAPEGIYEGQITEGPYVTNTNSWTKLGLKIALQQAVKEGADKIAWTTGEQQNKRYDLSKQVDAVTYEKNDDGTYNVDGIKNNRSVSYKEDVQADQLESMLGKDVAERIINDEGDTYFDGKYMGGVKVLTGDQLTVGGKGMTAFYGSMETPGILGNVAKALVKELTGVEPKIEGTELGYTPVEETELITTLDQYDNALKKGGIFFQRGGELITKKQAFEFIEKGMKIGVSYPKADVQPSIEITPELKAAVEKGMPQFSKGKKSSAAETEKVFNKATDLFYKIKGAEGSAKRKALADERKALMDKNPSIKFIDDNVKEVLDQLETKRVATRKGNCP
jgi:hypothetical protein